MTALLGMAALSIDASFMYDKRNKLFAAADAAAKSGAIEVWKQGTSVLQTTLEAYADQQVAAHGFSSTRAGGITDVVVNHPPAFGPFAGNVNYVEAIVHEPTGTFFGVVLGWFSMTPGARAVAGTGAAAQCLIALGPPGSSPYSLSIGASSNLNLNCNIEAAGDLFMQSSAHILGGSTSVAGECYDTGGGCSHVSSLTEDGIPPTDPLAGQFPVPADPGGCTSVTVNTNSTINPGCYDRIIINSTGVTLTLNPGDYYIKGPFMTASSVNQPTILGTGVMLYFAGTAPTGPCTATATAGCINIAGNNPTAILSAQTSGDYNGLLMWQESDDHLNAEFRGNNPTYDFSGAMYLPGADVYFRNGLSLTNDCTLFVTRSLSIQHGQGTFANACSAYGGSPILTVSLAE